VVVRLSTLLLQVEAAARLGLAVVTEAGALVVCYPAQQH
jgi:hypothetical protein